MTTIITIVFVIGYLAISTEHFIRINKAAAALLTAVMCWSAYIVLAPDKHLINEELGHHLGEISGILFFLLGAMTIVELVDSHDGFEIITARIAQTDKRKLLWILSFITFFLSAVLDNLTTTIVMISLLRKLISDASDRRFFAGMIVVAANAGGAWSPIGDVTTTMLWIGGQVTAGNIISSVFVPSLVSLLTPLAYLSFIMRGKVQKPLAEVHRHKTLSVRHQYIIFFSGILVLVLVPVFKTLTHLPPYMGMLGGLGVLWVITEILHGKKHEEDKHHLSVVHALRKIDTPSILFFLGILVSIAALQSAGILSSLAAWMSATIASDNVTVLLFGLSSAVIDNVPLVAAAQAMYDLGQYPTDHYFWEFLAYCTGTGGSALVIGSAAGVVAMGMENLNFFWYLKKISLLALLAYFAGAITYILQHQLMSAL